jgi:hypothetical protein
MNIAREMLRTATARKASSGGTTVVVVEEGGELVAIVADRIRGEVRIPLGTVERPASIAG